jgi:hypothetical protein
MAQLTDGEQARLEHLLAQIHRTAWLCEQMLDSKGDSGACSDMQAIQVYIGELLEDQLRKGGRRRATTNLRNSFLDRQLRLK